MIVSIKSVGNFCYAPLDTQIIMTSLLYKFPLELKTFRFCLIFFHGDVSSKEKKNSELSYLVACSTTLLLTRGIFVLGKCIAKVLYNRS